MKEVKLDRNAFWYDGNQVLTLDMGIDKHIRFTAIDVSYNLSVIDPKKGSSMFPVPDDGTYHAYEIQGTKGQTYTFSIPDKIKGTVPQMIVKIN
jgi:hypothetical protein